MSIFQSIINHKINTITAGELLNYANQFGIELSQSEANKIAGYLRGRNIDVFNMTERTVVLKEIEKLTSAKTAAAVSQIVNQFTK